MRILVAMPERSTVDAECAAAFANLQRYEHELVFSHADGRGVYGPGPARNRLAKKAIEGNYDYLLSIDTDIIVPPDAIKNLLEPPADIVLGLYRYKNDTGDCPFFKFEQVNGSDKWHMDEVPHERFEIKAGGFGCAMFDVNVFRQIGMPWFYWEERPTGHHTGEDVYFCDKARAAGFKIFADGRVRCSHVARKVYKMSEVDNG